MPQFLADYYEWWIRFWVAHPILWWSMIAAVAAHAIWRFARSL